MKPMGDAIYRGTVIHRRLRPVRHELRYTVFSLLLDVGELSRADRGCRLFSVNRGNLVSLHERDFGEGGDLAAHLRSLAEGAATDAPIARFQMLAYPRILGWVFNPLTVYYGLDAAERIRLMIYEVSNTFGERETYVIPVDPLAGPDGNETAIRQSCAKSFYVSPFNRVRGTYRFAITRPGATATVGIALDDEGAPLMTAWFRGEARALTDAELIRALAATGWMTMKVSAGIRYEAFRLWLKGLRPVSRPAHPPTATKFIDPSETS